MPEHNETRVWPERPKRRWQNLLHKKCPNCDSRLEQDRQKKYFICPSQSPSDPTRSCFFIKKETAVALLLDPNHPANFCLSVHERATVADAVKELGVILNTNDHLS